MTASQIADPMGELAREHREVIEPLLKRMDHIAELLDSGSHVPPGVISEGIELWERYLHGVHLARLSVLQSAKSISCGPGLQEVLEDHYRSHQRVGQLRHLVENYRSGAPHGPIALALGLRSDALVDLTWMHYEDEHPLSCLAGQLTDAQRASIAKEFQDSQATVATLENRIRRFLELPIGIVPDSLEIRCNVPSCSARALVLYLGSSPGVVRLGSAPQGWVTRRKDSAERTEVGAPVLAFYCPAHAKTA